MESDKKFTTWQMAAARLISSRASFNKEGGPSGKKCCRANKWIILKMNEWINELSEWMNE